MPSITFPDAEHLRHRDGIGSTVIPYFQELGQRVEDAWRVRGYDEESFPELVLEELANRPAVHHVGVTDIIEWLFGPHQAFGQPSDPKLFGEPPVMVFSGPRFYIEVLFWRSGTTSIHQHSFSGVFTVLAGSSVHSHWRFTPERVVNSRMLGGRLERIATEILQRGSMCPIRSGDRLIHQLFHLDLPSVTVVVRTYADRHRLPQYRYMPPGLAVDTDDRDATRVRRLMFIDGMARGQIEGLEKYARMLVENGDVASIYHMFLALIQRKIDPALIDELYNCARNVHGEIVDLFREVCEWERRTRLVISRRAKTSDPGQRFFLALLMLMPERDAILDTIRLQFPNTDPLNLIETWLQGMSGKEIIGFDVNDITRILFRGLVEGLDTEGLLQRLRTVFKDEQVEMQRHRLLEHARQLANSELFHPLFSTSPLRDIARVV